MVQSYMCSVFFVLLLTAVRTFGEFVPLGNSVELQPDKNCSDGELKLDRRLKDDRPVVVARRVDGVWRPEESYKGRIENCSSAGVLLKHVNFNDMGQYEFTCGGSVVTTKPVKVVPVTEVFMCAGEAVTLPCHSFTNGEPVKFIRWQRGTELVLQMNVSSGNTTYTTYGTGSEGRVSLSSEWRSHGNLSLTVMRTGPEDGRLYSCFVGYESGNRAMENPAVVRVSERKHCLQPQVGICSCECGLCSLYTHMKQKGLVPWSIILITVSVTSVIMGPLGIWVGWCLNSTCRSNASSETTDEKPATDLQMGLLNQSPLGPQRNGSLNQHEEPVCV